MMTRARPLAGVAGVRPGMPGSEKARLDKGTMSVHASQRRLLLPYSRQAKDGTSRTTLSTLLLMTRVGASGQQSSLGRVLMPTRHLQPSQKFWGISARGVGGREAKAKAGV